MTCWTYRIITSFTARVNFPSVHRVLKKPVRVCMTPHFLWHHILKEFDMIIFTGCSFSQGAHLWIKPHGYQNLLNRRPDTSARRWTGTIFTRLKSQTMNMIMHDDALHPLDLTPLSPVWNLWYSGWARYDLFSSSALINQSQSVNYVLNLLIPDAHFPVPVSTLFYLTFTSTPGITPIWLPVIPATRTDGLLHWALFKQHVLTCCTIHLSQFVMQTTFLLATVLTPLNQGGKQSSKKYPTTNCLLFLCKARMPLTLRTAFLNTCAFIFHTMYQDMWLYFGSVFTHTVSFYIKNHDDRHVYFP